MLRNTIHSLLVVALLVVSAPAFSQLKGFSLGPYAEAGWPTGDFEKTHKMGLGAGLTADIKLPGSLGLTGSIGYMQFNGKSVEGVSMPDIKAFPFRAGLKYRVIPLLYLKLEGGAATYSGSENGSAFIASPGIGLRLLNFDFQAKYEAWIRDGNTNAFWGLRAAINF